MPMTAIPTATIPTASGLASLIVGYGRAGRDLHHAILRELFGPRHPVLVIDPGTSRELLPGARREASVVDALATAERSGIDRAAVVGHVTSPPAHHLACVRELIRCGVRDIVLEKPVAPTLAETEALLELSKRARIVPVSVWPASRVTRIVETALTGPGFGSVTRIHMEQSKPRFTASLGGGGREAALDVEIPHQVVLALHLAGPAELTEASTWSMDVAGRRLAAMGGALLRLAHAGGVTTTLVSDLTSPIRTRRLRVTGTTGELIADYPVSRHDHHGQVRLPDGRRLILPDAPLTEFLAEAYHFLRGDAPLPPRGGLPLHLEAAVIMDRAHRTARAIDAPELESVA
jgi:predicted dehydrogenase